MSTKPRILPKLLVPKAPPASLTINGGWVYASERGPCNVCSKSPRWVWEVRMPMGATNTQILRLCATDLKALRESLPTAKELP